ncbi:hypothetical protein AGMMS49975_02720 [Clostridia bacterium]|nr:hypothetical protein AGMMS49975_02720 [Clostridia bacterium]
MDRSGIILPDKDFAWTDVYKIDSELPLFSQVNQAYQISYSLKTATGKAVHIFSASLVSAYADMTAPVLRHGKDNISAAYAVFMPIQIDVHGGVLSVIGANTTDRRILENIIKETPQAAYSLYYKPSALCGLPNTLIEKPVTSAGKLIKAKGKRVRGLDAPLYIVKALYNREYVYGTYWIYCTFAYLGSRFLIALTI